MSARATVLACVLVVLGACSRGDATAASSTQSSPTASTGNAVPVVPGGAFVYSAMEHVYVLFGGMPESVTWLWDGTSWRRPLDATPEPPSRSAASMVYDASHGYVLLFGGVGADGNPLHDTWKWQSGVWTQLHPATSPSARSGAAITFDAARGEVTLFGGEAAGERTGVPLNDTWSWDGSSWNEIPSGDPRPSPRFGAGFAYDPANKVDVLFGGGAGDVRSDTWIFDGRSWAQKELVQLSPPSRVWAAIGFDPSARVLLLFGGESGPTILGDSWSWDGSGWIRLSTTGPFPIGHASLANTDSVLTLYAAKQERGQVAQAGLWQFNRGNWRSVP